MNGKEIEEEHHRTFEDMKQENDSGMEFWYARDFQPVLDYSTWDKFKRVMSKKRLPHVKTPGNRPKTIFPKW
jgi:DNA-damage-inducible protein D